VLGAPAFASPDRRFPEPGRQREHRRPRQSELTKFEELRSLESKEQGTIPSIGNLRPVASEFCPDGINRYAFVIRRLESNRRRRNGWSKEKKDPTPLRSGSRVLHPSDPKRQRFAGSRASGTQDQGFSRPRKEGVLGRTTLDKLAVLLANSQLFRDTKSINT